MNIKKISYTLGTQIIKTTKNILDKYPSVPHTRVWAQTDELPRHLATKAAQKLIKDYNIKPESIDLIIYSTSFPDTVNIGFGTFLLEEIKASNATVLQIDCACASFLAQIEIAQAFIKDHQHKKILGICVSHMISRLAGAQEQPQGYYLGEGAGAFLIEPGEKNLSVISASAPQNHPTGESFYPRRLGKHDWDSPSTPFQFVSSQEKKINYQQINIALKLIKNICDKHEIKICNLNGVITNITNRIFLETLAEKLQISPKKFVNYFSQWGDLAQAAIPIILAYHREQERMPEESIYGILNLSLDASYNYAGLYWS